MSLHVGGKKESSMVVNEAGKTTNFSDEQNPKAYSSMEVTDAYMITIFSESQCSKAS